MTEDRIVRLPSGGRMPLIGLGTWALRGDAGRQAMAWALEAGYRHIDTATSYGNEAQAGAAVRDSGIPRDQIFVTTKMPPDRLGRELSTLQRSLEALDTPYVDLWLVHWPPGHGAGVESWRVFVKAREQGLARDIGVSNYSLEDIDGLVRATGVTPAVNQVKWSPWRYDRGFLEGSRKRGIAVEGYSPFRASDLRDSTLTGIAERHGKTPAQVIVRWHTQHGVVVIPKSARQDRIVANADVWDFVLSDDEMAALDDLH